MGATKLRDAEWLSEMSAEMSDTEIADYVGCTRQNVAYWRRQHGIEKPVEVPELRDPEWLEGELEDATQEELADDLGCSQSNVAYWRDAHDL